MSRERWTSGEPLIPTRSVTPRVHGGHTHPPVSMWSRRSFLERAVGAAAFGAVVGSGALRPQPAAAARPAISQVEPIPTTTDFFGVPSHVTGGPLEAGVADPSTVYNFQGATGIAFISGLCERRDRRSGETQTLPYLFNDMRFMKGVVRTRDRHIRPATFAFV